MALAKNKPPMTDEKKAEIAKFKADRRAEQKQREAAKLDRDREFAKKFVDFSPETLDSQLLERQNAVDLAKDEIRVIRKVRDAKQAVLDAQKKVDAMSDVERAALAQVLGTKSIASGEAHGKPSAKTK